MPSDNQTEAKRISGTLHAEPWWAQPASNLLELLGVDPAQGLPSDRVPEMRQRYGANRMHDAGRTGITELLWESLTSPMMLLLLAVAGISLLMGNLREAIVMAVVVLVYVGVELYNKARSDRTMDRLRELQAPSVTVLRDGERREVEVEDIVVGDILPLQPGTRVAADGRLLNTAGLLVDEAPLTGESTPQAKQADADVGPDAELAERPTAAFAGTIVLDGQGKALVTAVGERTELGRVAELTAGAGEEQTPLQREMEDLAQTLAYAALAISVLIPLVGWLRGFSLEEMVLTWLSLTFLMVPGQPPVIITMALALAAIELARKGVIVSRLRGAETLGSVNTILSDKTGTMTRNDMALASIILGDGMRLPWDSRRDNPARWRAFLAHALPAVPEGSKNPTDRALLDAGEGLVPASQRRPGEVIRQSGFARGKGFRSLTYRDDDETRVFTTGSPRFALERSTRWLDGERLHDLTSDERKDVLEQVERLAARGRRVVAYAYGASPPDGEKLGNLVFVGCAALEDPIREGVREAVAHLRDAGVRTVMVTGDKAATARQVAEEVGLGVETMAGSELADLSERQLSARLPEVDVFARVTPEQKLRLTAALKARGEVVAVTGDGINDAPALRTAHIGVAMGITGTDVAREAADLILTDDDFSHLPHGVAIGRKAYDNFRKGITYYLSAKAILLTAFLVPLAVGRAFPFAPIQIIAIELLMDLASSTIFISEAAEPGVMHRPPRKQTRFLSWSVGRRIVRNLVGPATAILASYFGSLAMGLDVTAARTAAFATWLLGHIVLALVLKNEQVPLVKQGLLANRFAAGWLAGMAALVLATVYVPFVRTAMGTALLAPAQWGLVLVGALVGGGWLELLKGNGGRRA